MINENNMTKNLERALKDLSRVPELTRVASIEPDYNVPRCFVSDIMDDSQREHNQRAMGLNKSLIIGEYSADFKY